MVSVEYTVTDFLYLNSEELERTVFTDLKMNVADITFNMTSFSFFMVNGN